MCLYLSFIMLLQYVFNCNYRCPFWLLSLLVVAYKKNCQQANISIRCFFLSKGKFGGAADSDIQHLDHCQFDHVPAKRRPNPSQLVQSAIDGYNICIFAYGQVGGNDMHPSTLNPACQNFPYCEWCTSSRVFSYIAPSIQSWLIWQILQHLWGHDLCKHTCS